MPDQHPAQEIHISHINQNSFDQMNDRIYDMLGFNEIVPGTGGKTRGEVVKTRRYAKPQRHSSNGSMLMVMEPVTRWHPDGSFTNESPLDIPGLITAQERSAGRMKDHEEWKTQGYFPDPEDEEGGGN